MRAGSFAEVKRATLTLLIIAANARTWYAPRENPISHRDQPSLRYSVLMDNTRQKEIFGRRPDRYPTTSGKLQ